MSSTKTQYHDRIALKPVEPGSPIDQYRGDHPRFPGLMGAIEQQLIDMAEGVTWPACPSWCELEAGHAMTVTALVVDADSEAYQRDHDLTFAGMVKVEQLESVLLNGTVQRHPPTVRILSSVIDNFDAGDSMPAARAYQLGEALVTAARRLEQITVAEVGR